MAQDCSTQFQNDNGACATNITENTTSAEISACYCKAEKDHRQCWINAGIDQSAAPAVSLACVEM